MLATLPIQVVAKMIYHTLNGNCGDTIPRTAICEDHGQEAGYCTECETCHACDEEAAGDAARDDQKDDDVTR